MYQENDARYASISQTEKNKRIKAINNFLKEAKQLQADIKGTMGARGGGSINMDTAESIHEIKQQRKQVEKDEDGELANTRGLDQQMLLQQ